MPLEYLNSPIASLPDAADPINIAGSGTGDVYGSWAEISASAPSNMFIAGLALNDPNAGVLNSYIDIQVGKGAAGSESVLATFGGYVREIFANTPPPRHGQFLCGMPISGISSGNRIAARMRLNNTNASNYGVSLLYLPNPITGTLETTNNPLQTTTGITSFTTSGTPWANAAWVQITASTSAAWIINHIIRGSDDAGEIEIDIGTGGAGAEAVIYTLRTRVTGPYNFLGVENLPILLNNIGNGVRVAIRVRSSRASHALNLRLGYY